MSQVTGQPVIPEWTLGWRLQRSLAHAGISVEQMAAELGVSRSTVSRWMNDRGASPRSIYVRQWARKCGVSLGWVETGAPEFMEYVQVPLDRFITRREWSSLRMAA